MQKPPLADPLLLIHQNTVHHSDLPRRPAKTQQRHPRPSPKGFARAWQVIGWTHFSPGRSDRYNTLYKESDGLQKASALGRQLHLRCQALGEVLEDGDQLIGMGGPRRALRKSVIPEAGDMGNRAHLVTDIQEQFGG